MVTNNELLSAKARIERAVGDKTYEGKPLKDHKWIKMALRMLTPGEDVAVDTAYNARIVRWIVDDLLRCANGEGD
jgi:hypothetical protein